MALDSDDSTFDNDDELEEQDDPEDKRRKRIRYLLLAVVVVALVCLVGALVYNILISEPPDEVAGETPAPTTAPTDEGPGEREEEEATRTPTRVVGQAPTSEPPEEPTPPATIEPTTEPTVVVVPTADISAAATRITTITTFEQGSVEELLKNGGFEAGFDDRGVGLFWDTFKNDVINVVYSGEGPGPYVQSGSKAQRITTMRAALGNRYTGIYQQVEVVPDETYTLKLHGQIRTGLGDVNQSSYGYRMQYAIGENGIRNWQVIPEEDWVELPWDEQLLNSPDVNFLSYTTNIVPTSDKITLFIRTWNKWPDPGEAQFTLDSLSLVGPSVVARTVEVVETVEQPATAAEGEEVLVDNGLPVTGASDQTGFPGDGRFWGALLILLLLAVGAVYRAKWSH